MVLGKGNQLFGKSKKKNAEKRSSNNWGAFTTGGEQTSVKKPTLKFPGLRKSGNNLSKGLEDLKYGVFELQKLGETGKIRCLAYDPIQSLMAVCTDLNHVTIFGQARVRYTLRIDSVNAVKALRFVEGVFLIAVDGSDTAIHVISLFSRKVVRTISTRYPITAFDTDYSLQFIFVGLKNGDVKAYDIETGRPTYLSIRSEQRKMLPGEVDTHVCDIKFHPRDFGTILIAYPKVCIIFSLIEDKTVHTFTYGLPKAAPGGPNASYTYNADGYYYPSVTHCLWHPNGLHIATTYDDNSIVFWDAQTGERLIARTLFDSYVDIPTGESLQPEDVKMTPIKNIQWICGSDPEKTSLLILGGDSYVNEGYHQLVRMDFGKMISYSMSSYKHMADYYGQPKQQNIFAIHSKADVYDFIALPQKSPFFDGNHNPTLIAVVLTDGSLKFLNYPIGNLSYEACRFPSTISWLNPKITCSSSSYLDRRILNSVYDPFPENRSILKGGIPSKPKFKAEAGSVVVTGHESGFIRIWNSSQGDLNSGAVLEIDVAAILQNDSLECSVSKISFAPDQMELSCSLFDGTVLLFSYQENKHYKPGAVSGLTNQMGNLAIGEGAIVNISSRAPLDVKRGFMPVLLLRPLENGKVTALCNSNVGFVAIGYESGRLLVIDRRGNVVIFNTLLEEKGLSIGMSPTSIQFGFGRLNDSLEKCTVFMYVGTSIGRLMTYSINSDSRGRFSVHEVNQLDTNDSDIIDIISLNSLTGRPCSPNMYQMSANPTEVDLSTPYIISVSSSDIRITKGESKVAHKTYSKGSISKTGITGAKTADGSISFCLEVIMAKTKKSAILSLPTLSEICVIGLPYRIDPEYAVQSSILPLGDAFLRLSETEAVLINVMNLRKAIRGPETENHDDVLFLKNIMIPSRPKANQLLKGTASVTFDDFYRLLMGENKKVVSQSEESRLAWNISPYNSANFSILGTSKPHYYDPYALSQHIELNKSPRSSYKPGTHNSWNLENLKKYANSAVERGTDKVGNYVSDMNDDFDKFVSQTKKDAMKSIFKGALN